MVIYGPCGFRDTLAFTPREVGALEGLKQRRRVVSIKRKGGVKNGFDLSLLKEVDLN